MFVQKQVKKSQLPSPCDDYYLVPGLFCNLVFPVGFFPTSVYDQGLSCPHLSPLRSLPLCFLLSVSPLCTAFQLRSFSVRSSLFLYPFVFLVVCSLSSFRVFFLLTSVLSFLLLCSLIFSFFNLLSLSTVSCLYPSLPSLTSPTLFVFSLFSPESLPTPPLSYPNFSFLFFDPLCSYHLSAFLPSLPTMVPPLLLSSELQISLCPLDLCLILFLLCFFSFIFAYSTLHLFTSTSQPFYLSTTLYNII